MSGARPIYLDHHATTPVDARVLEAMGPYFREEFGNPASHTHAWGWRAEAAVEAAREELAAACGAADPAEIVFTSGATESNNLALLGTVRAALAAGRSAHVVTVATEHPSVLDPCRALEREGARVTVLGVDADGLLDPGAVRGALTDETVIVSVMAANNEIGVLQPVQEIAAVCREHGVLFHTDAAQALGKVPFETAGWGLDLASFSGHKIYGPKGVGALYVRRGRPRVRMLPLLHGGGHERGLRPGTVPVPLVVGLGRAARIAVDEREAEAARLAALRDRLWERLRGALPGVHLNGHPTRRLPGNLNVSFEGVDGDALLAGLKDLAVSSGSACASAKPEPSHVLRALGLPDERVRASLRFGLGRETPVEDVDEAAERVIATVRALREARAGAVAGGR